MSANETPPPENLQKTQDFLSQWGGYHQLVNELDTYRHTTAALSGEIHGRLLDVGNGGVFNYDLNAAKEIVVVDLSEELVNSPTKPANVTFIWGDATSMPVDNNSFDTCLHQFLLHHLAEKSFAVTRQRTQQAIREAYRALKPGGRLVLIESCLPAPWEWAERLLFPVFRRVVARMGHPIVFQWNWNQLAGFARDVGFEKVELTRVSLGKWIIQLGRRWPTALTPVRVYKIVAHKPAK